jgi:monofunctional biosynthetic peptidoglycan transglycosylase
MGKRLAAHPSLLARLGRWTWRALLLALGVLVAYQLWFFAHILWWRTHNPSTSAFMEDRLELLQEKKPDARLRHQWVPYERVSNNLKRAVIAAEDARFLDHEGFDWDAIQKAYERNLQKGKVVRGGSTISQQLAKNLFLSSRRTPWRKAQEAVITVMLETTLSKRRILEIYLNVIEWGPDLYGLRPAARRYFGRDPAELTPKQMAFLVALVPGPIKYQRSLRNGGPSPAFQRLVDNLLAKLRSVDALTEEEYQAALAEPLIVGPAAAPGDEEMSGNAPSS